MAWFDKAGVSHNVGLSGIFVGLSRHRVDIFVYPKKKKQKKTGLP